jgi:hypothetical protein
VLTDTVSVYISGVGSAFPEALTVDGLTDYGYWDQSEQPDGITDGQWAEREAFWDRVTPTGHLKLTMTDLVVTNPSLNVDDPSVLAEILANIPSQQKRAQNVAAALGYNGKVESIWRLLNSSDKIEGLPELVTAIAPLLPEITAELLTIMAPAVAITVDRHPELGPLVDAVKVSLYCDKW